MGGDRIGIGIAPLYEQRLGNLPVQRAPPRRADPLIHRLADQCMYEARARTVRCLVHQRRRRAPLGDRQQRRLIGLGHRRPEHERHLLPDHRPDGEDPPHLSTQSQQARVDHLAEEPRHRCPRQIAHRPVVPRCADDALLLEGAEEFAEEERVALRPPVEIGDEPRQIFPA